MPPALLPTDTTPAVEEETSILTDIVVGHCFECNVAYDEYSGDRVCTVCRQPVLICPACVVSNPFPSEYYCSRHQDLKGIYFTQIARFPTEALLEQKNHLQSMLDQCLALTEQIHRQEQRKKRKKQQGMFQHNKEQRLHAPSFLETKDEREDEIGVEDGEHMVDLSDIPQFQYSKNRRRTLRKQIEKIDSVIKQRLEEAETFNEATAASKLPVQSRLGCGFWRS